MPIRGVEPTIAAMRGRLEQDLPATIAAVNAEPAVVADGITIPDPLMVVDYVPAIDELTLFPTVGLMDGTTTFQDDTGFSATGVHRLVIVHYLQNSDPQQLARQLRRYTLAIMRCALNDRSLGAGDGVAWGLRLLGTDPGPTLADEEDPRSYLSWSSVIVEAKSDEE